MRVPPALLVREVRHRPRGLARADHFGRSGRPRSGRRRRRDRRRRGGRCAARHRRTNRRKPRGHTGRQAGGPRRRAGRGAHRIRPRPLAGRLAERHRAGVDRRRLVDPRQLRLAGNRCAPALRPVAGRTRRGRLRRPHRAGPAGRGGAVGTARQRAAAVRGPAEDGCDRRGRRQPQGRRCAARCRHRPAVARAQAGLHQGEGARRRDLGVPAHAAGQAGGQGRHADPRVCAEALEVSDVDARTARELVLAAADRLGHDPSQLDHAIWLHMRSCG